MNRRADLALALFGLDPVSPEQVVVGRECRCGHWETDHEPECGYGWGNEPDEPAACPCEAFVHAWDVLANGDAIRWEA